MINLIMRAIIASIIIYPIINYIGKPIFYISTGMLLSEHKLKMVYNIIFDYISAEPGVGPQSDRIWTRFSIFLLSSI